MPTKIPAPEKERQDPRKELMPRDLRHDLDQDHVHEDLCTRCGKCCYKKIIVGRTVFITPFPCEFLDTATNTCTVYADRYAKNPYCLSVQEGFKYSAFPTDCGYVEKQAPPGYRPALDKWSWQGKWHEFDEWADDMQVSPETREKVRARGPHAPPMWFEVNERIRLEQAAAKLSSAQILWGHGPQVVDMTKAPPPAPGEVPQLAALLKQNGKP